MRARPQHAGYYERPGWIPIERDVGQHRMSVLIRDANSQSGMLNSPP
jgi:hypothetical protein